MSSETISYPHLEREQQPIDDSLLPKIATEFIGTFFLVFSIGMCQGETAPLGVGFTLIALIFMGGHISGAHYNPCVSLAVYLRQGSKIKDLLIFSVVQILSALAAAGMVNAITGTHPAMRPGPTYHDGNAFAVEVLWTFILISVGLNVATTKSQEDNSYFGLAIGAVIVGGIIAVGPISGACFNPALGTGLAIVDSANGGDGLDYLWLYWIGPIVGTLLASIAFRITNAREFNVSLISTSSSDNLKPLLHAASLNDGTSNVVNSSYAT